MVEKKCIMKKHYAKAGVNTDDNIPLNKKIKVSIINNNY